MYWGPICPESKIVDVFMEGPFPTCPEPLRAGPAWRVGLPAPVPTRRPG
jgi:hypothetical protein